VAGGDASAGGTAADAQQQEDSQPAPARWTDRMSPRQKRAFGSCASVVAGLLSGSTFTAPQYVVDATKDWQAASAAASNGTGATTEPPFPGASTNLLDFLFSHFTGIFFANVAYFMLYAAARRNRPWVSAELTLPSFLGGVCWGVAMVCWFVANAELSIVIAYPVVTIGPGIVSCIIGALVYRELSGWRSFWLVAASTAIFIGAAVLIVLSKPADSG
jgi:hypothetical protein